MSLSSSFFIAMVLVAPATHGFTQPPSSGSPHVKLVANCWVDDDEAMRDAVRFDKLLTGGDDTFRQDFFHMYVYGGKRCAIQKMIRDLRALDAALVRLAPKYPGEIRNHITGQFEDSPQDNINKGFDIDVTPIVERYRREHPDFHG